MGTVVNVNLLLNELRGSAGHDGRCSIFKDFKSAYNTVHRPRLYQMLTQKGILRPEETQFLATLHDLLYFKDSDEKHVHLECGVHQGSPPETYTVCYIHGRCYEHFNRAHTVAGMVQSLCG